MNNINRTKAASLNAATTLITQLISLILKFGVQTVFIHQLGQNYLGLNGLFSNVVSFLSFADLGIGTAITVSLYRPIANDDYTQLKSLLLIYRKVYLVIACLMTIVGLFIAPFIFNVINDSVFSRTQISIWFVLYFGSTIATYLVAWKRSFLMAAQHGYLNSLNDFIFKSVQQILQILVVLIFHSFLLFLIIQVIAAFAGNYQLSHMANGKFPQVFENINLARSSQVAKKTIREIKKNVVGAISSKIGTIIVFGTDNVILSAFIGLTAVAKYSNYMLIIQSLNSIFSQALGATVASIGNLHATTSSKKQEDILLKMLYANTIINLFVIVGLGVAVTDFIRIWAGSGYVLSMNITFFLLLNFLINQFRFTSQNFISGLGLYWPLRWKSIIEALVNLACSLFFVIFLKVGILGVVLGTLISNVMINIVWEPYIVYYHGLKLPIRKYFIKYFCYLIYAVIALIFSLGISKIIGNINLFLLILITILCELFVIGLFLLLTRKTVEFKDYLFILKNILLKLH